MKILIVEDEKVLSNSLVAIFKSLNYEVKAVFDGLEAVEECENKNYDLIIMDVMMPRLNGIEATKRIRKNGKNMPIIMLTAKSEVEDKVEGLDSGADDYLSKPFQIKELLARVRALLRRGENIIEQSKFGDILLNPNVFSIKCNNNKTFLTKKEFQLLEYLIRHNDRYTQSEKILEDVWNNDKVVDITVVWVYISNIRKKLHEISSSIKIDVSRGIGYKINV